MADIRSHKLYLDGLKERAVKIAVEPRREGLSDYGAINRVTGQVAVGLE